MASEAISHLAAAGRQWRLDSVTDPGHFCCDSLATEVGVLIDER
jgi:hypothetical protein